MGKNSGHEKAPVLAGAEALGNEINFGEEIVMGDNSTAASRVIPFRSAKLLLVERDGQPFVPMKPVVEGMGLAWQSQHRKLMAGRFASTITEMVIVAQDGKQREMTCLPLRKLTGWLMSIHPNKVRPELREGIIAYQNECDDVLWAYWNEEPLFGVMTEPRPAYSPPQSEPMASTAWLPSSMARCGTCRRRFAEAPRTTSGARYTRRSAS